jgi:hypothetical protein
MTSAFCFETKRDDFRDYYTITSLVRVSLGIYSMDIKYGQYLLPSLRHAGGLDDTIYVS